jgi:hypothetical protein
MTRAKDIKKSEFIAQTVFQAGDYLDFVRSGQNFRISFTNFIASLGVSGSLLAVGDVAAIPVYYLDGTVNKFRGVIGGSGIVASLSASDGVQIDHNFDVDDTGAAIMINTTAVQPTIRSIVEGAGITVTGSGDTIEIEHNFDIDDTGAEVIINPTADSPTVRSIVGGTGITVTASGDTIEISLT